MERAGVAAPTVPSFLRLRRAWETGVVSETVFGRLLGGFVLLVVVASSIVIEALPFILVGALASAAIAVFLPERALDSLARLPLALQIPGAALSGVAFPVCECGSVPVARRLIARGVHPGAGIAFMLSSPVLNPIVLASTWVAYGGHARGAEMVAGRASLGLIAACAAGLAIGRRTRASDLLRARPGERAEAHDHEQGDRATAFSTHLVSDFLFMGKFIVLGAGLSALVQASVPESALSTLGGAPVMSLCSEADAFIAASFTSFSSGAQLAFLVFGPIADLKLSVLYGATFRRWFLLRLLAVTVPLIVIGTLIFEAVT